MLCWCRHYQESVWLHGAVYTCMYTYIHALYVCVYAAPDYVYTYVHTCVYGRYVYVQLQGYPTLYKLYQLLCIKCTIFCVDVVGPYSVHCVCVCLVRLGQLCSVIATCSRNCCQGFMSCRLAATQIVVIPVCSKGFLLGCLWLPWVRGVV